MPTYAYRCTSCGNQLEVKQSFTDDPLTVCPECSGQLRKLFSSVGVVFKGSGFYRTDSRTSANSSVAAKKSESTGSEATSSQSASSSTSSTAPAKAAAS